MKNMREMVVSLVLAAGVSAWAAEPATAPVAPTNAPVAVKAGVPQTTCPIMKGNAVDKKLFVDYEGKRLYVCCRMCLWKARKNPAKYVKEAEDAGMVLEKTPVAPKKP